MRKLLLASHGGGAGCFGATAASATVRQRPAAGPDPYGYYSQNDHDGYYSRDGRYIRYDEQRQSGPDQGYDNGPPPDSYREGYYEDNCRKGKQRPPEPSSARWPAGSSAARRATAMAARWSAARSSADCSAMQSRTMSPARTIAMRSRFTRKAWTGRSASATNGTTETMTITDISFRSANSSATVTSAVRSAPRPTGADARSPTRARPAACATETGVSD